MTSKTIIDKHLNGSVAHSISSTRIERPEYVMAVAQITSHNALIPTLLNHKIDSSLSLCRNYKDTVVKIAIPVMLSVANNYYTLPTLYDKELSNVFAYNRYLDRILMPDENIYYVGDGIILDSDKNIIFASAMYLEFFEHNDLASDVGTKYTSLLYNERRVYFDIDAINLKNPVGKFLSTYYKALIKERFPDTVCILQNLSKLPFIEFSSNPVSVSKHPVFEKILNNEFLSNFDSRTRYERDNLQQENT